MTQKRTSNKKQPKTMPTAERVAAELATARSMDDFFGRDGIFAKLFAATMEEMLEAELSDHLGYEKYEAKGRNSGNNRNGSYEKKIRTSSGEATIAVPRDRNGSFEPQVVQKYQPNTNELEEKILGLYAKGVSTRDIEETLADLYGVNVSASTVSKVTDKVQQQVQAWQQRPLATIYPIIYLDAIHLKIRREGKVSNTAVYVVLAVDLEGRRDILGHWIGDGGEGANFWLSVVSDLQTRGVEDIFIACVDGLAGFSDAIHAVFPQVIVQRCIVHQICHFTPYNVPVINGKDVPPVYRRDVPAINGKDVPLGYLFSFSLFFRQSILSGEAMSGKRKTTVDIYTLLQHLRAGASNRRIKRELGIDRRTAQKYREWAETYSLLAGQLPPVEELHELLQETMPESQAPQTVSTVEPYRETVIKLREQGVEIAAIKQRLAERGFKGSYMAVYRFVRRLEPHQPDVTVRVETKPGEEAQVDFGYAGDMLDPKSGEKRKTWGFVMTLSWSRHQYVEFVFDQKIATWLRLHRNAFAFFGGVPERVVIDNLKAGVTKACWDEPEIQLSYRECAEHYGFLVAPNKPYTPQHKGKVEKGGVHYLKRNFLGGREATTLAQANRDVKLWCLTTAGQRVHGTTKAQPLVRFRETEQAALQPLPETAYDLAVWKQAKLHRDCYIVFDNAYYSAPFRFVGQTLRVCGGTQEIRLYSSDYQLIATHERAQTAGERITHPAHLPPDKLPGLVLDRNACQAVAADIGLSTTALVGRLLADTVVDRLSTVRRLLRLREQVGDERLEAACARALRFDDPAYKTVKRILSEGLEQDEAEELSLPKIPPARQFVRGAQELLGHLWGGAAWN